MRKLREIQYLAKTTYFIIGGAKSWTEAGRHLALCSWLPRIVSVPVEWGMKKRRKKSLGARGWAVEGYVFLDLEPGTLQARPQMSRAAHEAPEEKATSWGEDGRGALAQSTGGRGRRAEIHARLLRLWHGATHFPHVNVTTTCHNYPVKPDLWDYPHLPDEETSRESQPPSYLTGMWWSGVLKVGLSWRESMPLSRSKEVVQKAGSWKSRDAIHPQQETAV